MDQRDNIPIERKYSKGFYSSSSQSQIEFDIASPLVIGELPQQQVRSASNLSCAENISSNLQEQNTCYEQNSSQLREKKDNSYKKFSYYTKQRSNHRRFICQKNTPQGQAALGDNQMTTEEQENVQKLNFLKKQLNQLNLMQRECQLLKEKLNEKNQESQEDNETLVHPKYIPKLTLEQIEEKEKDIFKKIKRVTKQIQTYSNFSKQEKGQDSDVSNVDIQQKSSRNSYITFNLLTRNVKVALYAVVASLLFSLLTTLLGLS